MKHLLLIGIPIIVILGILSGGCKLFQGGAYDKYNDHDRRRHAARLLDIAAEGLSRFYKENGRFPDVDGKYFFDSIKIYFNRDIEDEISGFTFTTSRDEFGRVELIVGKASKERILALDSCYLAVWQHQSYIAYVRPNNVTGEYILYWVGLNWQDEKGRGDDIVYKISEN